MKIEMQEIRSDNDDIVDSGIYIDIILTKTEMNELREGELVEGCSGIKNKKMFFNIGLQGFYGEKGS